MDSETCYRRINNFSIFQFKHSITEMEISVIMCDHHHALPARTQIRQQLTVEDFLIFRILIRGPFIEDIDRTILQVSSQQCQAFSLPLRQIRGRECAVLDRHLTVETEAGKVVLGSRPGLRSAETEQPVEKIKIREHH